MVYSSRVLALLFALCISIITIGLFAMLVSSKSYDLVITFFLCLSVSFIASFFILETIVFRKIRKLESLVEKLMERELGERAKVSPTSNPVEKISDTIISFTKHKQKEIEELKKLEVFRREFIADVSHELKTPIFAAQGFVHTLLDGAVDDKAVRGNFLKKAARSLDGLDALVQDLLTLSHIETGQIKMYFKDFDLYKLTEDVVDQLEDKAEKRNIKLKIKGSRQTIVVHADWQRIFQVMTNLISNAIKHSVEKGEVEVYFDLGKKTVCVHVRDFGEGIPAEHIPRIFERFYRVDKSRSREKGGTGLGLAIVKHILENHGTKPEVESSPNKGSDFSFKLARGSSILI